MYLRKFLSPQIANLQVSHLRKVRKSNKLLSPQICVFSICVTFLRTAQLCLVRNLQAKEAQRDCHRRFYLLERDKFV